MKYTINHVREYLFDALEALNDKDNPMDLARAKTIAETAQVIINSAEVEVEFLKVTGQTSGGGFLDPQIEAPHKPKLAEK